MPFIVHYITPCLENHGHYSCSRAFFSDFPCVASRSRKCNLTEKCSKLCFFIQYRDFFPCAESTEAECPLTESSAETFLKVALVGRREGIQRIAVNHDGGRVVSALMRITQFWPYQA